jgi:recombination protein RecA
VDLGVQLNLVDKAGAWYSYKGDRIGQGKKNACEYLAEHSHLAEEIEQQVRAKLLDQEVPESDEDVDNVTPITGS